MVIYTISMIWKHGGEISRQNDGSLALKNADKIPAQTLKVADSIFAEIDAYFKSVESMNKIDQTIWKMVVTLLGNKNEKITQFLNDDQEALNLFFKYQGLLSVEGWTSCYEEWRKYENDETAALKKEIYNRAIAYFKK